MISLMWLLAGTLMGLTIGKLLYRHHYRKAKEQLEESKAAVREMMYQTHHQGINPISKRIRGLCQLATKLLKAAPRSEQCDESVMLIEYIEREALTLERDTLDKVKQFEHLQ